MLDTQNHSEAVGHLEFATGKNPAGLLQLQPLCYNFQAAKAVALTFLCGVLMVITISTCEQGCRGAQSHHPTFDSSRVADSPWRGKTVTTSQSCSLTARSESSLSPALDPDLTQAHELLAHTLRDMGLVEEAIQRYTLITSQRST